VFFLTCGALATGLLVMKQLLQFIVLFVKPMLCFVVFMLSVCISIVNWCTSLSISGIAKYSRSLLDD